MTKKPKQIKEEKKEISLTKKHLFRVITASYNSGKEGTPLKSILKLYEVLFK